ncbi:glycosyltransferase family protein [Desulfopila aestuarii]|uniref:Predicted glycosyl transferase n=1 Tax=Desulfopila aestuarii DSM 18488 TaxID=1121416 RepID=A0A1M7YIN2_9BACT|nr:glycosyltransferase [Desulfopila aestuarii]SHO52485.1 Predicted glycosyl transferase [Desulfopila aestuarii DSM 18488]
MRIAYYCQHVLGIGHFHRSLEICKELAEHHEVRLIVGGPPVDDVPKTITLVQLPGLQMDTDFKNLAPCNSAYSLDEVKKQRGTRLYSFFEKFRPEVFLVELYPFGRKAFRFELDPVLKAIRKGELSPCKCFVSLRDILVERPNDRERFEERVITTLNRLFDGLLVHADDTVITLGETFNRYPDIDVPIHYTGFVTPKSTPQSREKMRHQLSLAANEKLIVVSVGGGNVGEELLVASIAAFKQLNTDKNCRMQLFCGPYCPENTVQRLLLNLPPNAAVDRFSAHFPDWLQAADLSISMAGYNTCMNIVQAGIPALVYPFAQNQEQAFRARRLARKATITILGDTDLTEHTLATHIISMLGRTRYQADINLNGAVGSRLQIERWCQGV